METQRSRLSLSIVLLLSTVLLVLPHHVAAQARLADSVFALAQEHHQKAAELLYKGKKSQALLQFLDAADLLDDYEDYLRPKLDSIKPILQMLVTNYPESPAYNHVMGRWYTVAQKDTAGEQAARTYFQKALVIEPKFGWTYVYLARLSSRKGDLEEAIRLYKKSIELNPDFIPSYSYLVGVLTQLKREEEAEKMRNKLLLRDSTSEHATTIMLEMARGMKTLTEKEAMFRKAIRLTVSDWLREDGYRELMWTLRGEKPEDARKLGEWLLFTYHTKDRYTIQTAQLMIFYAMKRGQREEIPAYAERVINEPDPRLLTEIGSFCFDSLGNAKVGLKCLVKAYQVCTKDNVLGTVIHGSGIDDAALERVAKETRTGAIAPILGRAYFQLKNYDEAEKYLMSCVDYSVEKGRPNALYDLGYTAQAKGNADDAIKWLVKGLAIKHDDKAMEKLEKLISASSYKESATKLVATERRKAARPAIDFTLRSLSGEMVQLSKLKGKVVMIDFWATWCAPCVSELPHLVKLYEKYSHNPDVIFLSIDVDELPAVINPFMQQKNFSFKVLLAKDTKTQENYGVTAIPNKFLIDKKGRVEFMHIGAGPDSKVIDDLSREIDELLTEN